MPLVIPIVEPPQPMVVSLPRDTLLITIMIHSLQRLVIGMANMDSPRSTTMA